MNFFNPPAPPIPAVTTHQGFPTCTDSRGNPPSLTPFRREVAFFSYVSHCSPPKFPDGPVFSPETPRPRPRRWNNHPLAGCVLFVFFLKFLAGESPAPPGFDLVQSPSAPPYRFFPALDSVTFISPAARGPIPQGPPIVSEIPKRFP